MHTCQKNDDHYTVLRLRLDHWLAVVFLFAVLPTAAQVNPLLERIAILQSNDDPFYRDGMMPSLRRGGGSHAREDNNIFFTALTVYTLQSLKSSLNSEEQHLADSIIRKAKQNYPFYSNRNGELSYNFWQVHPFEQPLPNRKLWSKMRKCRLPDDLDDTSLIYLTLATPDSTNQQVKQMMEAQINQEPVRSTLPEYQELPVYRTWFADKMKQDVDICVLANVLLFVFKKELPLSEADRQTISLISRMLKARQHITQPKLISPHYQQTSIILYHLSRLLAIANHPPLNELKGPLISDLYWQLQRSDDQMEKVILLSSLYRLGEQPGYVLDENQLVRDAEAFDWFIGSPISVKHIWLRCRLVQSSWLDARHSSQAYYLALQLELELLSRTHTRSLR